MKTATLSSAWKAANVPITNPGPHQIDLWMQEEFYVNGRRLELELRDGITSTLPSPLQTYTNTGAFTAQMTVQGNAGQTGSSSQSITVSPRPRFAS